MPRGTGPGARLSQDELDSVTGGADGATALGGIVIVVATAVHAVSKTVDALKALT